MVIINNPYTFVKQAMSVLRLTFPDAVIIDQGFNHEFAIKFDNGKYGYCGVANGPLECNMFWSQDHMAETGQPYESIVVASVYEYKIPGYRGEWTSQDDGTRTLDDESMFITRDELFVWIDRGEYLVAKGSVEHLEAMAKKYMEMLHAITSTDLLDGPDVILYPETMEFKLSDNDTAMWGKKRCFLKAMSVL